MDIWNTACGICKDNGYPHISSFFAKRQETNTPVFKGSGPVLIGVGIIMFLILKQNDLGTDLLIAGTVGIMFLCSGVQVNLWIKRIAFNFYSMDSGTISSWQLCIKSISKGTFFCFP